MPKVYDGFRLIDGNYYKISDRSGPYSINSAGVAVLLSSGGSAGTGSDASAANQLAGNTTLTAISTVAGAPADAAATTDTGTFSLVSLIKRLLGKLPATLGAKTGALSLSVVPASDSLFAVNTLAAPGVSRQLAAAVSTGASANTPLTAATRRISIRATGSALRYAIGAAAQTASATSHFIAQDERLDLAVPASAQIAVLSATTTAGVLELTELS